MPLFLELVRRIGNDDAELARAALAGLARYQSAERAPRREHRPVVAQRGPARFRDCGGSGPPAVLIPSLINPPHVLDLDEEVSLASAMSGMGRNVLLLDWGPANARSNLSVAAHVERLLIPLLEQLDEPAALVGYCLGGTMAIAAANLSPVERLVTLAAPWRFSAYPDESRVALARLWLTAGPAATSFGALPMEVLQSAFWALDPARTVAKFAEFGRMEPGSPAARRFIALEDWANEGEALPYPAARELIEDMFAADLPGSGGWHVSGHSATDRLAVPTLHCTAGRDRIAPAETVARGEEVRIGAGHVGMIVGSSRTQLHQALAGFLDPACR